MAKGKTLRPTGVCPLCLQTALLCDSHYLPRAAYPRLGQKPVIVTPTRSVAGNKQISAYVLCSACESRFNLNGESYAMAMCWDGKHFPLREKLTLAMPHWRWNKVDAFSGRVVGVDNDKLAYFALSLLWRSAIRSWQLPYGMAATTVRNLGSHLEPIRRYLIGETGFPARTHVLLTVCDDPQYHGLFYEPGPVPQHPNLAFGILVLGIQFRILLGPPLPANVDVVCSVLSPQKLLYMSRQSVPIQAAAARLMAHSLPSKNLLNLLT